MAGAETSKGGKKLPVVFSMSGLALMQQQMKCLFAEDFSLAFVRQKAGGNALSS